MYLLLFELNFSSQRDRCASLPRPLSRRRRTCGDNVRNSTHHAQPPEAHARRQSDLLALSGGGERRAASARQGQRSASDQGVAEARFVRRGVCPLVWAETATGPALDSVASQIPRVRRDDELHHGQCRASVSMYKAHTNRARIAAHA